MVTHNISTFPTFTKLGLDHKAAVQHLTAPFEPYSDFNFISLFTWNSQIPAEVSILNGNLVIRMPDYVEGHVIQSILGNREIDKSLVELLQTTERLDLVPEVVIQNIADPSKFIVEEDRDNFDYVYEAAELMRLEGSKFKKVRNKANCFIRDHGEVEIEVILKKSISTENAEVLRKVNEKWAEHKEQSANDIIAEQRALGTLLENAHEFEILLIELAVDKEIKAFSINEVVDKDFAICHFEKALTTHHIHINSFLASQIAAKLHDHGCKWINWEQDLGVPGLRHSKLAHRPQKLLKKYSVRLA